MTRSFLALALTLALAGCQRGPAHYDREASARYQDAWGKQLRGDEDGYWSDLRAIASRYPDTRAGRRAQEHLRDRDQKLATSSSFGILSVLVMGSMEMMRGGMFGVPQRLPAPAQAPAVNTPPSLEPPGRR